MYCKVLVVVMVVLCVCEVAMVYSGMDWLGMFTTCATANASALRTDVVVACILAKHAGTDCTAILYPRSADVGA